jgi:excisionase family DNA binding protein
VKNTLFRPQEQEPIPRLAYRPREAAVALGLSLATVERLIRTGEIATVKAAGRCRLIRVESLNKYLADREVSARSP